MGEYLSRYAGDLKAFGGAYLLAMVLMLPVTVFLFGGYFFVACFGFAFFGLPSILVVALITAISANYLYKFAVYIGAVLLFSYVWAWGPVANGTYSWDWLRPYSLCFIQLMLLFGVLYFLLERARIGSWLREAYAAYWAHWEGPN